MQDAFKNFTLAVFGILFLLGIAWLVLNNRALARIEQHPFPHPFLDALSHHGEPLVIAYQGLTSAAPPNTIEAFQAAADLNPNLVLWVDARPTADGTWVAWSDRSLPGQPRDWVQNVRTADVLKADAGYSFSPDHFTYPFRGKGFHIAKLKDILAAFPKRLFVINLQDYEEGGQEQIVKVIDDAKAGTRSLIASPEDGLLRDLRDAEPTWLFGTSRAQVTRLIMLSQLFLAASAPIRADVFVWNPNDPLSKLNDASWTEIKRRDMKAVIAVDQDTTHKWIARADAVVTSFPEKYTGAGRKRPARAESLPASNRQPKGQ